MGSLVSRKKEPMPSADGSFSRHIGWWLTLPLLFSGCADGPLYGLKKMNPVITKQWKTDQELGPTYVQRLEEIQRLRSQIRSMSADEQAGWLESIEQLVGNDPSPEMRRQAVLALKGLPQQQADEIISNACKDESEKVRLAACEVLSAPPNPTRLTLLEKLAKQDESMAVRIAAVERLGDFSSDQALAPLEEALRDRSPALQYAAVQSLARTTGLKMSANVAQWRDYLEQNRDAIGRPGGSKEQAGTVAAQGERPVR
ncbi:MAG: HEAT repeat domain-containing protein [Pirellulaceae bacterium]